MSAKELVIEAVRGLPDDSTLKEVVEHVLVMAAIREGQADARAGRVISHEEMQKRVKEWTSK